MTHFPDPLDTDEAVLRAVETSAEEEAVLEALEAERWERRLAEMRAEEEAMEARLATYPEPEPEAIALAEAEAVERHAAEAAHKARVLAHRQALLAEAERIAAG